MKFIKFVLLLTMVFLAGCQQKQENNLTKTNMALTKNVRPAAVAGSFYPESAAELSQTVNSFLVSLALNNIQIKAIVAPHAGYAYSGQVAGEAFASIKGKDYKTVWLLGPSHQVSFAGVSVSNYTHYQTPLGEVKISEIKEKLLAEKNFKNNNDAHQKEHALEVELPFLQQALNNFEIVPMIFGNQTSLEQIKEIAASLKKYYDEETLIVVSSDFIHYGPNYNYVPFTENVQEKIKEMDNQVIGYLLNYQTEELYDYLTTAAVTNDGAIVLTWLSEFFKGSGTKGELVSYNTSGKMTEDVNSVSYVSMIFKEENKTGNSSGILTSAEKDYLLELARNTLNNYFKTGKILEVNEAEVPKNLKNEQGVFVTLEKDGSLRGCIGYIEPVKQLYLAVIDNAISAAVNDNRFSPVTQDELKDIDIEISVLSVPRILDASVDERLIKLRPLADGVVLEEENRRSTYLPQVWEDLSNPQDFLSSLCVKGGWQQDCWQSDDVKLYTYQAEVFGER